MGVKVKNFQVQVLLTVLLQIPLLTMGTIFTPFNPKHSVIRIANKNSIEINKSEYRSNLIAFIIQFAPTAFFINVVFFFLVQKTFFHSIFFKRIFQLVKNSNIECEFSDVVCELNTNIFDFSENRTNTNPLLPPEYSFSTSFLRHVVGLEVSKDVEVDDQLEVFQFLICLIVLSSGFVFPLSSFWSDPPIFSWTWIGSAILCIVSQVPTCL